MICSIPTTIVLLFFSLAQSSTIDCSGANACSQRTKICPDHHPCELKCIGHRSCRDVCVFCRNNDQPNFCFKKSEKSKHSKLELSKNEDLFNRFFDSQMYLNALSATSLQIECIGADSCYRLSINPPTCMKNLFSNRNAE